MSSPLFDQMKQAIEKILCGEIVTENGPTIRIARSTVLQRFKQQISEFGKAYEIYSEAKRAAEKQKKADSQKIIDDPRYRNKTFSPPRKSGLVWYSEFSMCVPVRPGTIENVEDDEYPIVSAWAHPRPDLPPDPTDWEVKEEMPCAYATLAAIYDKEEHIPDKQLHAGIWDDYLFGLMRHCVSCYNKNKITNALSLVKADLFERFTQQKGANKPKVDSGGGKVIEKKSSEDTREESAKYESMKPPSEPMKKAWESYEWVVEKKHDLVPDGSKRSKQPKHSRWYSLDMYGYLKENGPFYDNHPEESKRSPIPSYGSWTRYLRQYIKRQGSRKGDVPTISDQPKSSVRREDVQDEDLRKLSSRFDSDNPG